MKRNLSIIYVYYDTPTEIITSIRSIPKSVGNIRYEIIIIDNNSKKRVPKELSQMPHLRIIRNKRNVGFGTAINQAAKKSQGGALLLINPDSTFSPDAIASLYKELQNDSSVGVVGPKVVSKDGKILDSISLMPFLPTAFVIFSFLKKIWPFSQIESKYHLRNLNRQRKHIVPVVSGACMMVRRSAFEAVQGFDQRFFMYFEEADFCYRIKKLGFKIIYVPKSKIMHLVGRSSTNKDRIKKIFQQSRFKFFRKYHRFIPAVLAEGLLRFFSLNNLLVILIVFLSGFLNLYRIGDLMVFIGDYGRDYLAAREMLLTGKIPLVGITSSVTWLHQGPLSVYLIALALFVGKFHPVAPAVLYSLLGVCTTFCVYVIGKKLFNKNIGILSAAFYATSPLIVISARAPYHTSPIPLVASLAFLLLHYTMKKTYPFLPMLFFTLGILLQFELSNIVMILVVLFILFINRVKLTLYDIFVSFIAFFLGILPLILYDISHGFVQTIGFLLWIINRARLFLGLTISSNATTAQAPDALITTWQQFIGAIYPQSTLVVGILIFVLLLTVVIQRKEFVKLFKNSGFVLCLLWLFLPLIGFVIHTAPGPAYFPLLFPPIALIVGYIFYVHLRFTKIFLISFFFLIASNTFFILNNQYFMATTYGRWIAHDKEKDWPYGFGVALNAQRQVASFIVNDAKGKQLEIVGEGFLSTFPSYVDNYRYLVWWMTGNMSGVPQVRYILYTSKDEVSPERKVIYSNGFIYVLKDEK